MTIAECFPIGYNAQALLREELPLKDVLPNWRAWVELVQRYLQLELSAELVSQGTLKATVAVQRGTLINWALPLARKIHKPVLDFKTNQGELLSVSYISNLVEIVCPGELLVSARLKSEPESPSVENY